MQIRIYTILLFVVVVLAGCGADEIQPVENLQEEVVEEQTPVIIWEDIETESDVGIREEIEEQKGGEDASPTEMMAPEPGEADMVVEEKENSTIVVIDAGHQAKANTDKEPIGPGASEMKMRVSGGTVGRYTGLPEYELNLQVSLKLEEVLKERGYTVIMVRTANDVDISNSERAAIANDAEADVFVRIHANGSEDPEACGAMTICQTPVNPYNGYLYKESRGLAEAVLDCLVEETGCHREYVWETDTMSGINWATVPTTIVEMGYMTNPEEDRRMATEEYQNLIVQGIANGIDRYCNEVNSRSDPR